MFRSCPGERALTQNHYRPEQQLDGHDIELGPCENLPSGHAELVKFRESNKED